MSPEQQRIAIAEACGWTALTEEQPFMTALPKHWQGAESRMPLPDYLNDLNAMHEAEEMLNRNQLYLYGNELDRITLPKNKIEMAYVHGPEAGMYPELFRATAAQRAEAFLKTLGKWAD